ncbi:MAG TPA: CDGSH iron-sulfur domain-containing protein, partial [Chthonomonadaceae bacterium]|nr:CDGSH iron-sulfur domain-containing protein [Chthonomonadaceae bacterium]
IVTRAQVVSMIERCPSGALTYEFTETGETNEPDLPEGIAVITDGPLWVTGKITIERSDGKTVEIRNRMTLCRCGHSKNKPFCDGSHLDAHFKG